jgi:hypothetical protein
LPAKLLVQSVLQTINFFVQREDLQEEKPRISPMGTDKTEQKQ